MKIDLDKLIMSRFESNEQIEEKLKEMGAKNPTVFESESEITEDQDMMFDGCLNKGSDEDSDYFTLFYIIDRANNFYITETNYWS